MNQIKEAKSYEVEVDRPGGVTHLAGFERLENALGFILDLSKIMSLDEIVPMTPALKMRLFAITDAGREQIGTENDWSARQ